MKLVLVEWVDSHSMAVAWSSKQDIIEAAKGPITIQSVGWVVYEDDKVLTLIAHYGDENNCGGDVTIPKCAIQKRKALK